LGILQLAACAFDIKKGVAVIMLITNRLIAKLPRDNCSGNLDKESICRLDIERSSISKPRLKVIEAIWKFKACRYSKTFRVLKCR
jgi:hypothetical protein